MFHAWTYTVYTDSQTQTCCTQPKRDKYAGSVAGSGYGYGKVYQPGVVGWHLLLCVPLPPSAAEEGSSQRLTWWGRMFPQPSPNRGCGHAQRPVEEILSTPWPLHLVGVSRDAAPPTPPPLPHEGHTHRYVQYMCSSCPKSGPGKTLEFGQVLCAHKLFSSLPHSLLQEHCESFCQIF